eukprot:scaffold6781_cov204-Amphora_coffeaeformis.AAC.11
MEGRCVTINGLSTAPDGALIFCGVECGDLFSYRPSNVRKCVRLHKVSSVPFRNETVGRYHIMTRLYGIVVQYNTIVLYGEFVRWSTIGMVPYLVTLFSRLGQYHTMPMVWKHHTIAYEGHHIWDLNREWAVSLMVPKPFSLSKSEAKPMMEIHETTTIYYYTGGSCPLIYFKQHQAATRAEP